jgi:hypothetical protein
MSSLRIPHTATIQGEKLEYLSYLSELHMLWISSRGIAPADMRFLAAIQDLHVLIMYGFGDDYIRHLPKFPNIAYIDLQLTKVSASVAAQLQEEYPAAKVYFEGMKPTRTEPYQPSPEQSRQWREWPWNSKPDSP